MARSAKDPVTRALAILEATEFSTACNGYVLTSGQRNELLTILGHDGEEADDASAALSKRSKKR